MKINDVEKITGLTGKAIRLYESKGLINISRDTNGYRNYSDNDIEVLKAIKLLRSIDASVADIKLYLCGVISIEELVDKRKTQILKESGKNTEKYRICESIVNNSPNKESDNVEFTEKEEIKTHKNGALSVGIDIGTTTVSAVVYDIDNKEQLEAYSIPHSSYIFSDIKYEQNTSAIINKSEKLLYHILDSYKNIISIGITGQMHGIVYVNENGEAVSNLMNWQDKRADQPLESGKSTCEEIFHMTGESISTGYGVATHYYNMKMGEIPYNAVGICTIMDLFAMKICGTKKVLTHTSVASSLGMFDIEKSEFMKDKLSLIGIDVGFLPSVTGESITIGECRKIPVSVPIGDNQASFLGSVCNNGESILVNIGTGSQVSAVSDYRKVYGDIEIRPLIEGKYLICGSALCGGYAYSMLEEFFRSYALSMGMQDISQYNTINRIASDAYEKGEKGLLVDVSFFGKRSDPCARGFIKNIDRQSFTPSALIIGVLKGMCNELYELYGAFNDRKTSIVASGGAVKKNEVLKKLIAERFGMTVDVNTVEEEAATGVALFSALAAGKIKYNSGFSEYIRYTKRGLNNE
ncbi:MAG: MerR family transcriptional regulator [Clostridia bacterium]|nr:MerR family transcriptional regulator [Clostridia bacterium]